MCVSGAGGGVRQRRLNDDLRTAQAQAERHEKGRQVMVRPILNLLSPRHRWMSRVQATFTNEGEVVDWRALDEKARMFGWVARKGKVANYYRVYFQPAGRPSWAKVQDYHSEWGVWTDVLYRWDGGDFGKPPWAGKEV